MLNPYCRPRPPFLNTNPEIAGKGVGEAHENYKIKINVCVTITFKFNKFKKKNWPKYRGRLQTMLHFNFMSNFLLFKLLDPFFLILRYRIL